VVVDVVATVDPVVELLVELVEEPDGVEVVVERPAEVALDWSVVPVARRCPEPPEQLASSVATTSAAAHLLVHGGNRWSRCVALTPPGA
jgi:hypothetical protein